MHHFLENMNLKYGASDAAIRESEKQIGSRLPEEYVHLLKLTNGGEGFIGENSYLVLWGVEELASMNAGYEVQKYVPGLLIFGSDGGGEAYGFDMRTSHWPVVQVPFVGMTWGLAESLGESFNAFLKHLYEVS